MTKREPSLWSLASRSGYADDALCLKARNSYFRVGEDEMLSSLPLFSAYLSKIQEAFKNSVSLSPEIRPKMIHLVTLRPFWFAGDVHVTGCAYFLRIVPRYHLTVESASVFMRVEVLVRDPVGSEH